jgi:hypothetical protein
MNRLTVRLVVGAAAAALTMGAPAVAAQTCDKPTADVTIPDGQAASREEMLAAQRAVNEHIDAMNAYLECLDKRSEELPEGEAGDRARAINDARYNAARDEVLRLADEFNRQVRIYQVRRERPE